jgi:hypothetical protein
VSPTILRRLPWLLLACVAGFYAYVARDVIVGRQQWDFTTYYYAARALTAGQDPYSLADLASLSDGRIWHHYVYPPITLPLFVPFTWLDYSTSARIYLALKLAAVAGLLLLWRPWVRDEPVAWSGLLLLCIFGYRYAIARDLYAGNVTCFEQVLIWSAVLCWLRDRPASFSVLIACSSVFKITYIVLLLLLVPGRNRRALLSSLTAFIAYFGLNAASFVLCPRLRDGFVRNLGVLDEPSDVNPSLFNVIRETLDRLVELPAGQAAWLAMALHLCLIACLVAVTWYCTRRMDFRQQKTASLVIVLFLYALALPRFKDYAYVLLIVPSLLVLRDAVRWVPAKLAGLVLLCITVHPYQLPLTALLLFVLYLWHVCAHVAPAQKTVATCCDSA